MIYAAHIYIYILYGGNASLAVLRNATGASMPAAQ